MNTIYINKALDKRTMVTVMVLILLISSLSAVASQRGKLERNRDLQKQIESAQVLPDHKYYFSGGAGKPNAILGIHKDFQLVTGQWQGVQISPGQLQKWMSSMSNDTSMGPKGYYAAYIISPDGKKAGFWYSIESLPTIKFPGGNKIDVYPPDLNQPGELEEMATPKASDIEVDPGPEIEIEAPDMDMDDGGDLDD